MIFQEYVVHLHADPQLLLPVIRRRFWILPLRTNINGLVYKCYTCTSLRVEIPVQIMSDLPSDRVVCSE